MIMLRYRDQCLIWPWMRMLDPQELEDVLGPLMPTTINRLPAQ
jgi:hypothetical protein